MAIVADGWGTICDRLFSPCGNLPAAGLSDALCTKLRDGWRLTDQVLENWRKCHTGGTASRKTGVIDQRECRLPGV